MSMVQPGDAAGTAAAGTAVTAGSEPSGAAASGTPGAAASGTAVTAASDRPVVLDHPVVLRATDLHKRYGSLEAVRGVSFEIHEGETYGLLGPNGAGKTTTISIVCGLLARDAGAVTIDGTPIDVGAVAAKAAIGYVPQDLAIYPDLSARENLDFFGRLYGLSGTRLKSRVAEVLEIVGLTARAGDRTDRFSGGMQRRLNIGIGLLHRPRLLVLDEPTVGLDPQSRNAILESIAALGRQGMAILYTTHDMEEAERLCDRVGIIDAGRIRAEGTRRELVALIGEQDTVRLTVTGDVTAAAADVANVPGVVRADARDTSIEILVADARTMLPRLIDAAERQAEVKGVDVVEPDLEAVFLHLTGRALRDAAG